MTSVPLIDRLAGIECYCTRFSGIGGTIKQEHEGFQVSERVSDSFDREVSESYSEHYRYPLYVLEKRGVDSNHALIEVEREFHLRLRVMGIKDAKAVTKQFAGLERTLKDPPRELSTTHCKLYLCGFTRRPLGKEFLAGNQFEISIHGAAQKNLEEFVPEICKIGNFYGLQRFGSERLVTHLVGREIIKRNFDRAVHLLLSYTTEYDTPESKEMRQESSDSANYGQLIKKLPRGMDIERQVMSAIVSGKDAITALRTIPITIRRLFVQAFQAYVFNKSLSRAIASGADLTRPEPGDLCFEMEGPSAFGRVIKFENYSGAHQIVPAIRMAGSTFQPGKGRFDIITRTVMEEERVEPKDFYIKEMQELSQQGGFRQAPLWCMGFKYRNEPSVVVEFGLPKGSYATTLLRELVKPVDPIKAGF